MLTIRKLDDSLVGWMLDMPDTRAIVSGRSDAGEATQAVLRARGAATVGRRFAFDYLLQRLEALDPNERLRIDRRAGAQAFGGTGR